MSRGGLAIRGLLTTHGVTDTTTCIQITLQPSSVSRQITRINFFQRVIFQARNLEASPISASWGVSAPSKVGGAAEEGGGQAWQDPRLRLQLWAEQVLDFLQQIISVICELIFIEACSVETHTQQSKDLYTLNNILREKKWESETPNCPSTARTWCPRATAGRLATLRATSSTLSWDRTTSHTMALTGPLQSINLHRQNMAMMRLRNPQRWIWF